MKGQRGKIRRILYTKSFAIIEGLKYSEYLGHIGFLFVLHSVARPVSQAETWLTSPHPAPCALVQESGHSPHAQLVAPAQPVSSTVRSVRPGILLFVLNN